MRVGFALPHVGPVASRDNIRLVALEAERLGYDSLWTLDRVVKAVTETTPYPPSADGRLEPQYDVVFEHLSVLTYVAAITERIRLGVCVLNLPLYHPVLLAKRIATMDQLSGGRIDLGVGAGWSEDEFHAVGASFRDRGRLTEEYILALKALWSDDPVEFHGELVDVPPAIFGPKPLQRPHPPLYMGAFAPAALRRGGRLADGFTGCCAPVDALLDMRRQLAAAALAAGRGDAALPTVVRCNLQVGGREIADSERAVGTGTWSQVRADVQRLAEAGVEELFFDVSFQPDNDTADSLRHYLTHCRGLLAETAVGS